MSSKNALSGGKSGQPRRKRGTPPPTPAAQDEEQTFEEALAEAFSATTVVERLVGVKVPVPVPVGEITRASAIKAPGYKSMNDWEKQWCDALTQCPLHLMVAEMRRRSRSQVILLTGLPGEGGPAHDPNVVGARYRYVGGSLPEIRALVDDEDTRLGHENRKRLSAEVQGQDEDGPATGPVTDDIPVP